jgi:hypothetical protein
MAGHLGGVAVGPTASTIEVGDGIDGGPPWGVLPMDPAVSTTEVEDVIDGGAHRGCCRWVR